MKKLLLILSLIIAIGFNQQSKAQVNHLFWQHNSDEFAGYGALYNWYAASTANFAPVGWHVPSYAELVTMTNSLGGASVAGGKIKKEGLNYWNTPNTGADNSSGFSSVGSGIRSSTFNSIRQQNIIWTTTLISSTAHICLSLSYSSIISGITSGYTNWFGVSIRLIKDDSIDPGTLTDYDGNIYKTVKIGTQVWIASNWKCEHLNDGTAIPIITDNSSWAALTTMGMCYYNNDIRYK